jgi:hypothetical protein
MEGKLSYKAFTIGELYKYKIYDFVCDGDKKEIILTDKDYKEEKSKSKLLEVLRKEIGE